MNAQKVVYCLLLVLALAGCGLVLALAHPEEAKSDVVNGSDIENVPTNNVPNILDFSKFIDKYRKAYSPLETLRRAQLFLGRTLKIFQHNLNFVQKKVGYYLGQTEYTDITPDEVIRLHGGVRELEPVKEAKENPDAPASSLLSVRRYLEEESGRSSCSAEDLRENVKLDQKTHFVKPVLSFMEGEKIPDMRMMLRELKEKPELTAKMAEVVDVKSKDKAGQALEERARKRNRIQVKSVVPSNNKNYEPQMISSQAAALKKPEEVENYAKYLMEERPQESMGGFKMSLYPEPETSKSENKPSALAPFLGSIKMIGDYFFEYEGGQKPFDVDSTTEEPAKPEEVPKEKEEPEEKVPKPSAGKIQYKVDWRKTGCVPEPRHQEKCNACYAFATLSMFEYLYCRKTKQVTRFSAQYLVDCGPHASLNGCQGGKIWNVGKFITKFGLELDSMYPYSGEKNQCPFNDEQEGEEKAGYLRPTITGWQRFHEMVAWYEWIRKSPVVVGINMPLDFLAYKGGIHDGLDCVDDMTHAMLLVGAGSQDGQQFWLLKNSYSGNWGENGYFRLSMNAPLRCFNSAVVARAKFEV